MNDIFDIISNPFDKLQTEYLRREYFKKNQTFIQPQSFTVDSILQQKIQGETNTHKIKNVSGQFIPMGEVLKNFLQLPNVYNSSIKYMDDKDSENSDRIDSFLKGNLWGQIKSKFQNRIVVPLTIYFDDLEVNNPLGSHAGVDKVGVVYYKITTLPLEYSSTLDNIFLASIHRTVDRQDALGNTNLNKVLQPLIKELSDLEKYGIKILTNRGPVDVYFAVAIICGDNLGLHLLLGFNESFNSNYHCRFCREKKTITQKQTKENANALRTVENYTEDLKMNQFGIKQPCFFNELKSFHVTENLYADIMHDQ